jgi:hypothetical protein
MCLEMGCLSDCIVFSPPCHLFVVFRMMADLLLRLALVEPGENWIGETFWPETGTYEESPRDWSLPAAWVR